MEAQFATLAGKGGDIQQTANAAKAIVQQQKTQSSDALGPEGTIIANLAALDPSVYETVDFNPLLIYEEGMSPSTLMTEINVITPLNIDLRTAEDLIYNIERYYTLLDYLREEDE